MKRNNLYLILLFFYTSCMSQKNDYKVVYSSNNDIKISYYFHSDNKEYARVYGNSIKSDSLAFVQNKNDLIVNEFKYNDKEKKRLPTGNIKYINYYTKLSDIIASENAFSIDEVPVNNLNFIKKDWEIKNIIEKNCKQSKVGFNNCDFILPSNNEFPYWPSSAVIASAKIRVKENSLEEIELEAKYQDNSFNYKRSYYYNDDQKIEKIITSIKDNSSTESYEDKFIIVK
ncbi:hypothetical protein OK18_13630 [Chryseobacterium gallinarum]|uniref:Uncharacterized protein n=1 Tax=Chryseobacterium gallinarum TaxID=1324352 RepID=A0A0G3M673_CHRGL|nr:hypothetical protein [Chryseobacterium gallinarum]AKK73503.1 hypothetical protein OK18_13630 [Chryseobacterium gallinarum]